MKARQKRRAAGPTTGCRTNEDACIEEKQKVSPPAVRYAQKNIYIDRDTLQTHESELGHQLSGTNEDACIEEKQRVS
jgi:hypothetical protein